MGLRPLATLLVLAMASTAFADEPAAGVAADADAGKIAKWIEDLGSEDFNTRDDASAALSKAGAEAIPALVEAAQEGFGLETPTRAVKILVKFAESDDEPTAKAAKAGLEKLTKSDRKFVARLAESALEEPAPQQPVVNPFGGRIVIQQNAIAGNGVRIQHRVVNGERTIDVDDNGKKIKITDTNGKDIVVKVEEQVNGQAKTTESKGEDLADLKKKHPDAARLYEKYVGRGNAIQLQFRQARIQARALPNGQRIVPRARIPFVPRRDVDQAIEEIDESIEELKKLAEDERLPMGVLDDALERLEEAKQRLKGEG